MAACLHTIPNSRFTNHHSIRNSRQTFWGDCGGEGKNGLHEGNMKFSTGTHSEEVYIYTYNFRWSPLYHRVGKSNYTFCNCINQQALKSALYKEHADLWSEYQTSALASLQNRWCPFSSKAPNFMTMKKFRTITVCTGTKNDLKIPNNITTGRTCVLFTNS
jgi:hypothetical protein